MKNGYLIKLFDKTEIQAIPNKDGKFTLEIGETSISIVNGQVSISGPVSTSAFISEISSISEHEITELAASQQTTKKLIKQKNDAGIMRTCIVCGPRWYCITNGCAYTPCGSICD
ncbi:hypothetical protein ACI2KO_06585 [Pseudomonas piscis]|uniref:hypothetical protein n=1 Tax=Pseudomonas piscis TaxID=2614538 RepID=UPI00384B8DAF